jgi:hypothetical protein
MYKTIKRCLDSIFPYSKSIEFETDKINYIMSSVFLLANRLAKSVIGLAEVITLYLKLKK